MSNRAASPTEPATYGFQCMTPGVRNSIFYAGVILKIGPNIKAWLCEDWTAYFVHTSA